MIIKEENNKKNIMQIFITISILLISIFPIFGKNGNTIQEIIVWITIMLGLIICSAKKEFIASKFLMNYGYFIVFSAISIIWSQHIGGACVRVLDMVKTFLFILVLLSSCKNKDDIMKYLNIYLIGVVFISVFCIIKDFASLQVWARLGRDEFETAGQTQIYYSCILIYATIFSIYRLFTRKSLRSFYVIVTIFLYICCLLTAIRKCMIIPAIFLLCYSTIFNRKNLIKLLVYTFLGIIIIIAIYFIVNNYFESMAYRINGMVEDLLFNKVNASISGDSVSTRKWLRNLAIEIFKSHPLTGVGIGQFRFYASERGLDLYSHDNFLEILSNTGIIGFIIYYKAYLSILICGIKKMKSKEITKENGSFIVSFLIVTTIMEYGQVEYYQLYFIIYLGIFSYILNEKNYHLYFSKKD